MTIRTTDDGMPAPKGWEGRTMFTDEPARPSREEAISIFRELTRRHGLRWNADVPSTAYDQLARANLVLTADDRRAIVLGRAS